MEAKSLVGLLMGWKALSNWLYVRFSCFLKEIGAYCFGAFTDRSSEERSNPLLPLLLIVANDFWVGWGLGYTPKPVAKPDSPKLG